MNQHYSVNVAPLWTIVSRYQLNPIPFFDLLRRFLLNRNEEIFNIELQHIAPVYGVMIKQAINPILDGLSYHMDITDNLSDIHFVGQLFIIETINLSGVVDE
jgi:hypothetical protein